MSKKLSLNDVVWKEYSLGDLFTVRIGNNIDGNKIGSHNGKTAYVTRKTTDNGLEAFIDGFPGCYLNRRFPVITVGNETAKPFVQNFAFYTGTKVNILIPIKPLDKNTLTFIATCIEKISSRYSYSFTANSTRLRKQIILLPNDQSGNPNWWFMGEYIKQERKIQAQRIVLYYKQRILGTTSNLVSYDDVEWKEFFIGGGEGVFDLAATKSGVDKKRLNITDGEIPYVTRSDLDNGINLFITDDQCSKYKKDEGNVITIGLDTQTVFYQANSFYTGQNIQVLRNNNLNTENAMFIIPLLKIQMRKFNWGGNGATLGRLKRTRMVLPVDSAGNPNWQFMETYIKQERIIQAQKIICYYEQIIV